MKYQYSIYTDKHGRRYDLESDIDEFGGDLFDAAAKDYHYNHNGWEAVWPIEFKLYDASGNIRLTALVEREVVPAFRTIQVW